MMRSIHSLLKEYYYDFKRYYNYSSLNAYDIEKSLIGKIILEYHVVEKGLTMPDTRLGFGRDRVLSLCKSIIEYINKFGTDDEQLRHSISVILEYEQYHVNNNYSIDNDISDRIKIIRNNCCITSLSKQKEVSKEDYYKYRNGAFDLFSNSRTSIRNFSPKNINSIQIKSALNLAQNTPSACNRQSWRTYVYSDSTEINQILALQGGNRGFGHLTNKLIVVTCELGMFSTINERNQIYVDGGMYAMNIIYSLHFYEIAACILNCSHSKLKDLQMRKLCKIKESEVFIVMIACGIAPDNFKVANSKRYSISKTNNFV